MKNTKICVVVITRVIGMCGTIQVPGSADAPEYHEYER
jgi:hypothetical protein